MQALIHNSRGFSRRLGGYLVVRFLIPDGEAIRRTIKVLAVICVIQGVCMINEQITHVNVFGYLGGIPIGVTVRDGNIRSEGVMGCLYAGVFAGVLIPLFLWLWTEGKSRMVGVRGTCRGHGYGDHVELEHVVVGLWREPRGACLLASAQADAPGSLGIVADLVALHLVMKAPVWALIAHIDLTGSSSGYHRYMLVDNCIRHFSDWWLLGYKVLQRLGMGHVGSLQPVCCRCVDGRSGDPGFLYRDFQPELWGDRDGKEAGERGPRRRNGSSGAWVQTCLPMWWRTSVLTIWLR